MEERAPADRRLTAAVAMATYNGGRYLEEQLRSIAGQSRLVDEIVVADDGSTDETMAIVRRMAKELACPVTVVEGTRLGPAGNFERALRRVTADVVFLSDQDDMWRLDKVETVMERFEQAPAVGGIFTDGSIVSEDAKLTARSLWELVGFTAKEQRVWAEDPLSVLLRRNVVTGAALAVRSPLLPVLLPLPSGGWHDLSMAVLLASTSTLEALPQQLIGYRLHGANAAGLGTGTPRSRLVDRHAHVANLDQQQRHWRELRAAMAAHGASGEAVARADAKLAHLARRRALPVARVGRLAPTVRELARGAYRTYAADHWSAVRDLVGP